MKEYVWITSRGEFIVLKIEGLHWAWTVKVHLELPKGYEYMGEL